MYAHLHSESRCLQKHARHTHRPCAIQPRVCSTPDQEAERAGQSRPPWEDESRKRPQHHDKSTDVAVENQRPLPFTYKILNEGLYGIATILKIISDKHNFYPHLATKFLDISYEQADFNSKFLQDCYSTMTARINNILTKETVRCFTGSDFTGKYHHLRRSSREPVSLLA
jgi:hypothetical protein